MKQQNLDYLIKSLKFANMKYHKSIGFPTTLKKPIGTYKVGYSKHAIERMQERCINPMREMPGFVRVTKNNIIEMETTDNIKAQTVVVRMQHNKKKNLILVLEPSAAIAMVITFWINDKTDDHKTIDKSKYNIPS